MIGKLCRALRLKLVLGAMLAPVLASAQPLTTHTTLNVESQAQNGGGQTVLNVQVLDENGQPATGGVAIRDYGQPIAGASLNAAGEAHLTLTLASGAHQLTAAYLGSSTLQASSSAQLQAASAATSGVFGLSSTVSPSSVTLTAGQSSSAMTVTVTPQNGSSSDPTMYVSFSCSGLPDQASCTFSPQQVAILPGVSTPLTTSLTVQTQAASARLEGQPLGKKASPFSLAFLLPGALALAGLSFGARRKSWLSRVSMMALLGALVVFGATACSPRYDYLNHSPEPNVGTPTGSYTIAVVSQTSNGAVSYSGNTTFALTVK